MLAKTHLAEKSVVVPSPLPRWLLPSLPPLKAAPVFRSRVGKRKTLHPLFKEEDEDDIDILFCPMETNSSFGKKPPHSKNDDAIALSSSAFSLLLYPLPPHEPPPPHTLWGLMFEDKIGWNSIQRKKRKKRKKISIVFRVFVQLGFIRYWSFSP